MSSSRGSLNRKRSSVVAPPPPSVAWLEPLALSMTIVGAKASSLIAIGPHLVCQSSAVQYRLSLQPRASAAWSLSRSFDDYRAFQKRLLKLMDHGHFCTAECPWLYTFVKSYFPKKSFFGTSTSAREAERRRDALLRCFVTLQTFLLNRANHACPVVVDRVGPELRQFVLQDAGTDHPLQRLHSFDGVDRCSSGSFTLLSDEDDTTSSITDLENAACALCSSNLDAEPYSTATTSSDESQLSVVASNARSAGAYYTTTLSCGHEFHDECIVPKLNDAMRCPTCGTAQVNF